MPLNLPQKAALTVLSAVGALLRPGRADLVGVVGETTGVGAAKQLRDRMRADATGRMLLQGRPRVTNASVASCWDMEPGTFGAAYAQFMGDRNFQADSRPPVRFVDDAELAYVLTRAREVHDFWHVLFDCNTDIFGELAIKGLEFVQTGLPMSGLAVAGAQWRLPASDRRLLNTIYMPWALRAGIACTDLICLDYEQHFQEDLDELRKRWKIITAPLPPAHLRFRSKQDPASPST
ncbi:MAG: hypothetical protein WDW38_004919 [Sanguina aurantia]